MLYSKLVPYKTGSNKDYFHICECSNCGEPVSMTLDDATQVAQIFGYDIYYATILKQSFFTKLKHKILKKLVDNLERSQIKKS